MIYATRSGVRLATKPLDDVDLRALVHIAGPAETEPDDNPLGYIWVQRCLRCDELLAEWHLVSTPGNAFRVGRMIATDPYRGIAGGREAVDKIGKRDRACSPIPVSYL